MRINKKGKTKIEECLKKYKKEEYYNLDAYVDEIEESVSFDYLKDCEIPIYFEILKSDESVRGCPELVALSMEDVDL